MSYTMQKKKGKMSGGMSGRRRNMSGGICPGEICADPAVVVELVACMFFRPTARSMHGVIR